MSAPLRAKQECFVLFFKTGVTFASTAVNSSMCVCIRVEVEKKKNNLLKYKNGVLDLKHNVHVEK